ncbi:MAG: Crp/Fnr family transcriptional regulator [Kordia sp.]|uniref:Crp/Fnr family transcriptional regulator n=1 Tax=Kordia sp. TaxID=1965332 RepID=UPI003858C838
MNPEIEKIKLYITDVIQMDDSTFNSALDYFVVKEIKKGDYVLREGQICDRITYISTGLFRTFHIKNGNEINTCFCMENSITSSHESFVNQVVSKEYIQALEDAKIVTLSYKNLMKLFQLNPKWESLSRVLTEKECARLSERIDALSFETAKEKYLYLLKKQPEIIQRVAIQHIASYLGVSRETLSRIRSKIS